MAVRQIYHGSDDYWQMVQLRERILRKPLGLSFSKEELNEEAEDVLIGSYDDDELIATCLLRRVNGDTMKLRQMAVHEKCQGKGIGENIVHYAENIARDKGCRYIIMNARDTAVGFYERCGYSIYGEPFEEVGLPHHSMGKKLF